jgi:hypothetical protein
MSEARLQLQLLYPLPVTEPVLQQHGCQIEELRVAFPQGTRREAVASTLFHAQRYRVILPDGIVFDELFHLAFQQSMLSLSFATQKGRK